MIYLTQNQEVQFKGREWRGSKGKERDNQMGKGWSFEKSKCGGRGNGGMHVKSLRSGGLELEQN